MLQKCPECEREVSDKATACPHCGCPLKEEHVSKPAKKRRKRMRLPNGFGQISELKNHRLRKPFRAMVTVGKTEEGKPICKSLKPVSYFATYNEAYTALMEYHKNPYDLDKEITFKELYERWSAEHFKTISEGTQNIFKSAWSYCSVLYDLNVRQIKIPQMKKCLVDGACIKNGKARHPSANVKNWMKMLFNQLFDYAVEYDLTDKNYARLFDLSGDVKEKVNTVQKEHISFTDEEIRILWEHANSNKYAGILLVQCYSGWRPQELYSLELSKVDLENWTFQGGVKTKAGKDRIVPIHSKIRNIVVKNYEESKARNSKYLFTLSKKDGKENTYSIYQRGFAKLIEELGLDSRHRPHDGRKQFVTMAKEYEVDEYAIKYLVGHSISDITEKVYTDRSIEWLSREIEKIK